MASDTAPIKIEAASTTTPTFTKVTLAATSDFPGATTTDTPIPVKVGSDGTAILLEKPTDVLPACGNSRVPDSSAACTVNSATVSYCIKENKIYKSNEDSSGNKSCNALVPSDINTSYTEAGSYTIYFDAEGQVVTPTDDGKNTPNIAAYLCTFSDATTLTSCTLVSGGFVIDSKDIVTQCSGWRREGCTVTKAASLSACAEGHVLTIGKDKKVCFGSEGDALANYATTSVNVTIAPTTADTNFGIMAEDIEFIALTSNSVLITNTTSGKYKLNVLCLFIYIISINKIKKVIKIR